MTAMLPLVAPDLFVALNPFVMSPSNHKQLRHEPIRQAAKSRPTPKSIPN